MKLGLLISLAMTPAVVQSTYSIAAVDQQRQLIGGAGAGCVQSYVAVLYHAVPGHGVLLTQTNARNSHSKAIKTALTQIEEGLDAATILEDMKNAMDTSNYTSGVLEVGNGAPDSEFQPTTIVSLNGQHAAIHSESQYDEGGSMERYTFNAQANVAANNRVELMVAGFSNAAGCDLPDRLMNALEAASKEGGGHNEGCSQGSIQSKESSAAPMAEAFVKVQGLDGTFIIDINVTANETGDPTIELREKFDAWRSWNPCPSSTGGGLRSSTMNSGDSAAGRMASMVHGAVLTIQCIALLCLLRWSLSQKPQSLPPALY